VVKLKKIAIFLIILLIGISGISAEAISDSALASALINAQSGEIIYQKNSDKRLPMASTTKIMTALLLCEYGNLERSIKVTREMVTVEGSSMGLLPDDIVTLNDLLYGMMLASGNDAANTTAFVVGGTIDKFVNKMNEKAIELGLKNTHFVTPSGLDADEHYTTAYELALLAAYALKNSNFKAAASAKSAVLNYGNPPYRRTLTNHNKLLKTYDGLIGVKTGFTKKSGRCLVTAAERDGKRIVAVTLNDSNDWQDHKNLLDYGFSALKTVTITPKINNLTISVVGGNRKQINAKIPKYSINTLSNKNITTEIKAEKILYAPIKKGQRVGEYNIFADGKLINTFDLYSEQSVEISNVGYFEKIKNNFIYILSSV